MKYFEYLDELPKIPEDLATIVLTMDAENRSWFKDPNYRFYRCPPLVKEWLFDNIKMNIVKVGVQEMVGDILPHIDTGRDRAINYLLKTGGGILSHYTSMCKYTGKFIPLHKVSEVSRVDVEPFRWHTLDTSKLHGVSNIKSTRLAVTINVA